MPMGSRHPMARKESWLSKAWRWHWATHSPKPQASNASKPTAPRGAAIAQAILAGGVAMGPSSFWDEAMTWRLEEHTYELTSLMRRSYAVFCLKKKKRQV